MPTPPILERLQDLAAVFANGAKGARLPAFLQPPLPTLGVEISPRRVSVVRLAVTRGVARVAGHASVPLAEGVISPALLRCAVARPTELSAAVRRAVESAGGKPGRAALVLPDLAGRVTLTGVANLPAAPLAADELLRFRMKRALPLRPDELALSWMRHSVAPPGEEGVPVLVVVGMRGVIDQYEKALAEAGLKVGLVSLATIELANLCRAEIAERGAGDTALLNLAEESVTLAIFRGGELIFYRSKSLLLGEAPEARNARGEVPAPRSESGPADTLIPGVSGAGLPPASGGDDAEGASVRMRDVRRELSASLSYFREKLAGKLPLPVLLRTEGPVEGDLTGLLSGLGMSPVSSLDSSTRIQIDGTTPMTAPAIAAKLAPALGVTAGRRA